VSGANRTATALPHVGTYTRELPVSVERMYENALDWEHLPYLHRSSFAQIECVEAGDWGWRARVWSRRNPERAPVMLELALDRKCRRWITRTLEGQGAGTEIWTHAFPISERRTDIVVDFFMPGVAREGAAAAGEFLIGLYTRLYDEDVWMMTERQRQLDFVHAPARQAEAARVMLGAIGKVRARLPMRFELDGRTWRIVELRGELIAHATVCPHLLGPLSECAVETGGVIECPWHGYRFDIRSRACVSGARCSLAPAPRIAIDSQGRIFAEMV
jgi:nitrite reductase/ring-hydroxylating ferredoxin subunit